MTPSQIKRAAKAGREYTGKMTPAGALGVVLCTALRTLGLTNEQMKSLPDWTLAYEIVKTTEGKVIICHQNGIREPELFRITVEKTR